MAFTNVEIDAHAANQSDFNSEYFRKYFCQIGNTLLKILTVRFLSVSISNPNQVLGVSGKSNLNPQESVELCQMLF